MANRLMNIVRKLPQTQSVFTKTYLFDQQFNHSSSNTLRPFTHLASIHRATQITSTNAGTPAYNRYASTSTNDGETTKRDEPIELMPVTVDEMLSGRSLIDLVSGWVAINLGIKKVEPDFNIKDFLRGAAQAIEVVSGRLSEQKFDELEGMVTPEALAVIKPNVERLNDDQRRELRMRRENISKIFWKNIKLSGNSSIRTAEITVKIHMISNKPNDPEDFKKFL